MRDEQPFRGASEVELLRCCHEIAQGTDLELIADRAARSIHALSMVIRNRQVLDARARPREGDDLITNHQTRRHEMFDPGAMGTLLIGLNAERADEPKARSWIDP